MRVPIRTHLIFTAGFLSVTVTGLSLYHHNQIYNQANGQRFKDLLNFKQFQKQNKPSESLFENLKTMVKTTFQNTPESKKVVFGLVGINTLVFLAWQVPQLSRFMNRHFVHLPIRSSPHTLLTCVFSHQNLMHFGFNMMALTSFYPYFAAAGKFSTPEALSFYLSAGVLSSLASHLLSSAIPARALAGGLGASGAIYGLVAGSCYFNPSGKIGIMFIPYSFEVWNTFLILDARIYTSTDRI